MSAPNEHKAGWSPDRVATLRKSWAAGHSASEIAKALGGGVTRLGVIGKVHRLGLQGRDAPTSFSGGGTTVRRPTAPTVRSDKYAGNALNARRGTPPKPGPQNTPGAVFGAVNVVGAAESEARRKACEADGKRRLDAFAEPANDTSVPLIDRRRFQCSWPVGEPVRPADQMCCGSPVVEDANRAIATYCAKHGTMALTKQASSAPRDAKVYERSLRRFAA